MEEICEEGEMMEDNKRCKDIEEIFRENKIGLYDLCRHWIYIYPKDVFLSAPDEIVQIRVLMERILSKRKKK